ncbi:MAG: group 1 truncated hemoglobin, partial [Verrucomicrobiales bacterium]
MNLFDKIGGAPAVARLVESFYARVMADPALKPFFEHASVENLIAMQREFFTAALGGPGEYRGKSLAHAH